ncbi:hypothetical protein niasHT_022989 [Heterodera trifolii]|uniref:Ras GTPase-activating protein n=1 Tax=Heterodera trifolii TaxID=157864 RepID=A0ABD2JN61_9BILA
MRRWDEKQRRIQSNNGPNAALSAGAQFAAVSSLPSPSSALLPPPFQRSPTVLGDFIKMTKNLVQSQNERMFNRDISPAVNKECVPTGPSSPRPSAGVEHCSAAVPFVPGGVPSSPASACHSEFVFDHPSPSSTSPSFVPSSPMPSSSKWRLGTMPKSAVLMSKCQSFLKSSSSPITAAPSAAISKNEMAKNEIINHRTKQREKQREGKKENRNDMEDVREENIFNFEGLFEEADDETFVGDKRESGAANGPKPEIAGGGKDGPEMAGDTTDRPEMAGEEKCRPGMEVETVYLLSLARENETLNVKCDWPFRSKECCTVRILQQKNSERKDGATQIEEGFEEDGTMGTEKGEEGEGRQRECQGTDKQSHQPRSSRRAPRLHLRRDRPPPLPLFICGPTPPASSSVVPFHDLSVGGCSPSPSTSTISPPIPSNAIYSIRIGGIQLRNVPPSSAASQEKDVQLVVAIRLDRREVFRSCPVHLNRNCCVISEEFCMELPRSSVFHSLQLSLFELTEGARIQRCIGRMKLTRHELVAYGNTIQERWLPIARIRPSELTETLGAICAELSWNGQRKMLTLRVFDFTIWSLPSNNGRVNSLQRHCNDGGRLFLKCRLGFGHSAFSAMQKMRLVERRSVEPVRFDCSHFLGDKLGQRPPPQREGTTPRGSSPRSSDEWTFCRSPCVTPISALSANEHFRFNPRHFKFPPPPSPAFINQQQQKKGPKTPKGPMLFGETHLYIKLYGKPNYSEDSFCGFVHIPLETETMKPRETPHGPNWFNIRSKGETTILTQFPTFVTNNTALCSSISKQLTTSELNSTPPSPFPRKQAQTLQKQPCPSAFSHHRRVSVVPSNSSPAFHRNCSPGSASSASSLATVSHTTVANARLKPLTTPSAAPLFSPFGVNELNNNDCLLYNRKNKQQPNQRHLVPFSSSSLSTSNNQQDSGEIRLKLWYDMDEVHPFVNYRPLYLNLVRSLNVDPHACSLISLIQCLPVDLENLAKPLMKIFVHSNQIRQFFRAICMDYVKSCNDVNTLFRSQSLASKVMYEMMKFVGQNYLFNSLKPLIDLIFAERKCCEIDPSKLKTGDSLDQNFRSITTYAELAFDQVVNSLHHCPKALRELFSELRGVVEQIYPNRQDVARLAVSSFLIMRFFAAAILNPKLFSLKLETPDVEVSRTLVLVSKVLQRISNCVVSAHPLTNKEQWLTPVLQRFSDRDKIAMIQFLDKISKNDAEDNSQPSELNFANNENISPASSSFCEATVLKSGYLIERRCSPVKKRSFKSLMHSKRRFVLLTDASLIWHKSAKDGTASSTSSVMSNSLTVSGDFNAGVEQQKSQIALSEVTSVGVLPDAKNAFRVSTMNTEVHFQANSEAELNEWIILIQKQQRRQLMVKNRSILNSQVQQQMCAEIDLERELHVVYTNLATHMDTLCDHNWCCRFECARCDGGK